MIDKELCTSESLFEQKVISCIKEFTREDDGETSSISFAPTHGSWVKANKRVSYMITYGKDYIEAYVSEAHHQRCKGFKIFLNNIAEYSKKAKCAEFDNPLSNQEAKTYTTESLEKYIIEAQNEIPDMRYLKKHGIDNTRVRGVSYNKQKKYIVVPIFNEESHIIGLELLADYKFGVSGTNKLIIGTRKNGHFAVGNRKKGYCFVAEGWASAERLRQEFGGLMCVAFSADNVPYCAKYMHELGYRVFVSVDNDKSGREAFGKIDKSVKATPLCPPDKDKSDFADYGKGDKVFDDIRKRYFPSEVKKEEIKKEEKTNKNQR